MTHEFDEATQLTPRKYQLELCERAKTDNIIAVLDTGSGKTFVAECLLKTQLPRREDREKKTTPCCMLNADTLIYGLQEFESIDSCLKCLHDSLLSINIS